MSLDQVHFLHFLLEVVLFEFTYEYGGGFEVSSDMISHSFEIAANVFRDHPDSIASPCLQYIRSNGLDDETRVGDFLQDFVNPKLLPKRLIVESSCSAEPKTVSDIRCSYFNYLGYKVMKNTLDVVVVILPDWSPTDLDQFKVNYLTDVPGHYMDDLSALVFEILHGFKIHGSQGFVSKVRKDQAPGVGNYSREFAESTLAGTKRRLQQDIIQEQERKAGKDQEPLKLDRQDVQHLETAILVGEKADESALASARRWDLKINDHMKQIRMSTEASPVQRLHITELRTNLENSLRYFFRQPQLEVCLCGSFATGLCTRGSDVDFTVTKHNGAIDSVVSLAKALEQSGYHNVRAIGYARIPIAMFIDPVSTVECDISLDQRLGGLATRLISTYRQIDDRFETLWFAVLKLAKVHDIWSGRKQFLPSYALVLMMIVYLQSKNVPVLPRLQCQDAERMTRCQYDGWDCSFDEDWCHHRHNLGSNKNKQTPAEMLRWFCFFYGYQADYGSWEINARLGEVMTVRQVDVAKDPYQREKLRLDPICVMDPFSRHKNVTANVSSSTVERAQMAFRAAYDALAKGDVETAFSKAGSNVQ
ncbi:hypothetical protein BGZ83_001938 [Gryganskiella cystojenkinii]|nr:hypothetical protein BGZ83_001938 [Gryganskiella cystojenkinii]